MASGLLVMWALPVQAQHAQSTAAEAVTRLADVFVAEYERRFPFAVMESGLSLASQTAININSPRDLRQWRAVVRTIESQLARISDADVARQSAWITRAYLQQAIAQEHSHEVCRSELWKISPYEWPFRLRVIAQAQAVGTARERREALKRWEGLAAWIDQDAANLAEGLRLGFSGFRGGVEAEIQQIDALIAAAPEEWPTTTLAKRASNPDFARRLHDIRTGTLLPAARRYRDFLRNDYLPKARSAPSITIQPLGAQCLQERLLASTTVDMDPKAMFETVVARRKVEHVRMLELGRQVYGISVSDWPSLVDHVLNDPRSKFRDVADINSTLEAVLARARAALPVMLTHAPSGAITLQPFPSYAEATSPAGQFFRGPSDGSQPPIFSYRANPLRFPRVTAESLTLHETIPGHYLQASFLDKQDGTKLHAVARLVYAQGPSEGWATYAEGWAAELGLYSSAFDEMGAFINSVTPSAVADLGMQVMGWDVNQAAAYLQAEMPLWTPSKAREAASGLASSPGDVESYPVGTLQYEAAHERALAALGSRFDSREFHQMLLSDGALPFAALNSKADMWIASHR
jgi:uncharacterized protein (DUF885 family)